MNVPTEAFKEIAIECNIDLDTIVKTLRERYPDVEHRPYRVMDRIRTLRTRGQLPLDSGNTVSIGEVLRSTSTLYSDTGTIKQQWVKTDVPKQQFLEAFNEAISDISANLTPLPEVQPPLSVLNDDCATLYISNDIHFGAYNWGEETETDWSLDIASETLRSAYDHLFAHSPDSKIGIVCDLGDLTETDDFKNMTPKSGNILDVDSRYPKILRAAYEAMIYAVQKALDKHELVYFYNIAGNHDMSTGVAIREVIRTAFRNNPRVIVDESPRNIKYHQHGTTLLQFAHGDGMRLQSCGEVMAHDCVNIFSSTVHRYAHLGHTHKDAVVDSRLCRAESHRNIASLNAWAFNHGYRRNPGTMKSITYHAEKGEISRQLYSIS